MLTTAVDSVERKANSPLLVIVLKDFRHLVLEFPGPEEAQDIADALHLLSRPGKSLFPPTWAYWTCGVLCCSSPVSIVCIHLSAPTPSAPVSHHLACLLFLQAYEPLALP